MKRLTPAILLALAALLIAGLILAVQRGTFGFRDIAVSLILPAIIVFSAVRIWKLQDQADQK
jgi:hypothetical protein